MLSAVRASAQEGIFGGMRKSIETTFSTYSLTTTSSTGAVTRTESTNFYPSLNLSFDALVYSNLRLNAGGEFELNYSSPRGEGSAPSSTLTRSRPFVLLRSTNPVFSPGIGYFRREERARTAGQNGVKLVNEEYAGYLGWMIDRGPRSDFQYLKTNTFDDARALQNLGRTFSSLLSNYTFKGFGARYRGSYTNTDDAIKGVQSRQVSNGGRLSYSDSFIRKRLLWNATYDVNHVDISTVANGNGGELELPLIPSAGLSSVSDTPLVGSLPQNAQLIDGNLTAGAGIDLGVPAQATDSQPRHIGIELPNLAQVNRILVWVDRQLPVDVANSFSWEVYSSADNLVWRLEATVPIAPFGAFENRFQIDFNGVTSRYIKVVTRPLSVTVPESSRFPDILVTEVQPFLLQTAGAGRSSLARTSHVFNTDVRLRILTVPALFYEGFYLYNKSDALGRRTETLSNGMSVTHSFSRVFSAFGRIAREQGTEPQGHAVSTVTNATLTVDPVPTFRSSLLYNGRDELVAGIPYTRHGIFVQNTAQIYRGVDLQGGFGWSYVTRLPGESSRDRIVNLNTTITPREHVSLTASYEASVSSRSGDFAALPESSRKRGYVAVVLNPLRTLQVSIGEEVYAVTGARTRLTLDAGLNWSPMPDGALQFVIAFNEARRDLEFGSERNALASVRWNLSRRSYVDLSFQRVKSEYVTDRTDGKILSLTMRLFF
jgi:hypothetical protein